MKVALERGAIVIRLPVAALAKAVEATPDERLVHYDEETGCYVPPRVTNPQTFADEVLRVLNDEQEDGTTVVHEMFDAAIFRAIEDGALGVVCVAVGLVDEDAP